MTIKSELLSILKLSNVNAHSRKTTATSRSLQTMLATSKKRKRADRTVDSELNIAFQTKRVKLNENNTTLIMCENLML